MSTYTIAEAKERLHDLIDQALKGEPVTITRDGVAVIEMRPPSNRPQTDKKKLTAEEWILRLREARERHGAMLGEDAGTFISRMRDEEWEGR